MKFRWILCGSARLSMAAILATSGIGLLTGCGGSSSEDVGPPVETTVDPLIGDPAEVGGESGTADPAAVGDVPTP